MNNPDALGIAFEIADQSREIVKLVAIGICTDGSLFLSDTGLSADEIQQMCSDFQAWRGDKLAKELES